MKFIATYYRKNQATFLRYTFSEFKEFFDHLNENNEVELYELKSYVDSFYPATELEKIQKESYIRLLEHYKDLVVHLYIINPSKIQGDIEICETESEIYSKLILDRNIFELILDIDTILIDV